MQQECRERFPRHRFQRKPLVSDPNMHHGTCVTHVPWCMSGFLTRGGEENVPGIPGACATGNFWYLARVPFWLSNRSLENPEGQKYSIACNRCHYRSQNTGWQTANALVNKRTAVLLRNISMCNDHNFISLNTDNYLQWDRRIYLLVMSNLHRDKIEANTKMATILQATFPKSI